MNEKRMPLRRHLEELRGCLLRSFFAMLALFVAAVVYADPIIRFAVRPWSATRDEVQAAGLPDPGPLTVVSPAESFLFGIKVALAAALLVGAPYYMWELWRFVGAGLLPRERAAIRRAFPPAVLLLAAGLTFGFTLMIPYALYFFATYLAPDLAEVDVRMSDYLNLVISLSLLMGGLFQLPLVMWLVVRAGLMKAATLASSRRIAYLVLMIFAAMMTPPDVVTMVLVSGPMVVLYEVGLMLARRAEKAAAR